ncbi:CU044_5270 family protein [Streptomyces flavofungini]|uniref:CU044_5270 family protein n=1 Tax=Streptomyces flavofungini TaxID=68200 RepID=UPI0034DFCC35
MNQHDTSRSGDLGHSDAAAIAGLLPVPADWDLPDERYLRTKELLMAPQDLPAPRAARAGDGVRRGRRGRGRYRRHRRRGAEARHGGGAPRARPGGVRGRGSRPTYRWLAALPTDPDALLEYLYDKMPEHERSEPDQAVFDEIGSLVGGVMPPRTAAALYRAAARIPGVEKTDRVKDAIGRRGLGIVRNDTTYGQRTEWVFDPDTLAYIGSRTYLTRDGEYGKRGTLLSSTALVGHAVVDRAGQVPGPGGRPVPRRSGGRP